MKLVNLTPHEIKINDLIIEPSGDVARLEEVLVDDMPFEKLKIPVVTPSRKESKIVGLPETPKNVNWDGEYVTTPVTTVFVTSRMVAEAAQRPDVMCPDTGPTALRDENGHIVGVKRLIAFVSREVIDADKAF